MTNQELYVKSWELAVAIVNGIVSRSSIYQNPEEIQTDVSFWQKWFYEQLTKEQS